MSSNTGKKFLIDLSGDEALVVFDFLFRFRSDHALEIEDQSEQRVLWNILAGLEKALSDPFAAGYDQRLQCAREAVRGPVLSGQKETLEPEIRSLGDAAHPKAGESFQIDPANDTWYSMNIARTRPDGTIEIPAGGYAHGQGIWDGTVEIRPDNAKYGFWVWLVKRWPYQSTLSSSDLPALDAEYETSLRG